MAEDPYTDDEKQQFVMIRFTELWDKVLESRKEQLKDFIREVMAEDKGGQPAPNGKKVEAGTPDPVGQPRRISLFEKSILGMR